MKNLPDAVSNLIKQEVIPFLYKNLRRKRLHYCLACQGHFRAKSRYHHFCSRQCYGMYHRIPGFIRKVIRKED